MDYMSAKEAAEKFGVSHSRILKLCAQGRLPRAKKLGTMWLIPALTSKPIDGRTLRHVKVQKDVLHPFLKWVGGKRQLLGEISKFYPFEDLHITKYAEPFIGGGAVLFDILSKYHVESVYISDLNPDLINAYVVVQNQVDDLIPLLYTYQNEFWALESDDRKKYYCARRERFNELKMVTKPEANVEKAALMLFLNRTCFNGLYRVNRNGHFNAPIGSYKHPVICNEPNLRKVSEKLQGVEIVCGDYHLAGDFIDDRTFVYFDPPYRPLSVTAKFTDYTSTLFDDQSQRELARFVKEQDRKGARILLSNSDPKNSDPDDNFFEEIYSQFMIERVEAVRLINSNRRLRGRIKELLISNF